MKNNNNLFIGFGLGLIVAGTAGYYLNTKEGKKLKKATKKQLKKLKTQVAKTVKDNSELVNQKAVRIAQEAKSWSENFSDTIQNGISQTAEVGEKTVDKIEESFQSGVDKARKTIETKSAIINNHVE